MNKLYQRINWQNYPSDSTPLNESNLNKMDAAVDGIDDRVVTLDVTKLPVSTANTMVKDVTFNESTGVFTITKLNGTKVTVNTALEKIATNFRYDHSTQKLILTLIDGTTQEVDLSALLTQYEFLNSSTIQFTIDSSGKVKASVVNGSITGDMLEPNYLANVTLQASKADTSAKNAKESEGKAAEYAESAKNSADSAEPVASTATGTNPTIQDSTNAPFIYGKFKGYTEQQTYSGKNLMTVEKSGSSWQCVVSVADDGKITLTNTATTGVAYGRVGLITFKANTTYTISVQNASNLKDITFFKPGVSESANIAYTHSNVTVTPSSDVEAELIVYMNDISAVGNETTVYVQVEEGTTITTYEPYVGGIVSPNPDYPQEINGLAKNGTTEVKTCGKNLLKAVENLHSWHSTVEVAEDGKITITNTSTSGVAYARVGTIALKAGKKYAISLLEKSNFNYVTTFKTGTSEGAGIYYGSENKTFTVSKDITVDVAVYMDDISTVGNTTSLYIQIEEGDIFSDYETYTETTAAIPTDAPLYEGDYLEVYADGSGKEYRKMKEVVFDGSESGWSVSVDDIFATAHIEISDIATPNSNSDFTKLLCNSFTHIDGGVTGTDKINKFALYTNNAFQIYLPVGTFTNETTFKTWLQSNPVTVVYELAKPTETPLTTEQVEQFKKLYTFEPVTNVLCDGEVEMIYLKNTNGGKALASVRRGVEHADTATTATTATKATQDGNGNVIAETYYRKANFDKIVGGTVEPSGKTNVVYSVPTEVSSKGVVVQTNTSGTLINALSKATASISGFFSILYNAVKTKYLGRIDLGMSAIQNTYDFTSFAGYDRYTFVFKGTDANRSLFTRELLTIHNIEKNTSNVGKVCLNISNNYTFEPWVEMYPSRDKTYIVVQLTDTTGLTTLVSDLYVEVYGAMD